MDARTKKVSLEFIGESWKDCFVEMRYLSYADTKRMTELDEQHEDDWVQTIIERIRHLFVSGRVLENGQPVELTREGIAEFDIEALRTLNNSALGFTDPRE